MKNPVHGIAFIANHFGVNRKTIYRVLDQAPELKKLGPEYPWPACKEKFEKYLSGLKADTGIAHIIGHENFPEEDDEGGGTAKYFKERAEREKWAARMVKLNYLKAAKKLIDAEVIAQEWETIGYALQKSLLLIPDRIAPLLVNKKDPREIRSLLAAEIKQVLTDSQMKIAPPDEPPAALAGQGKKDKKKPHRMKITHKNGKSGKTAKENG